MPTPLARPPITDATALPCRSVTARLRVTWMPARSGSVGSAAPSMTAVSGAWASGGGVSPVGIRNVRQSVAAKSSPPGAACAGRSLRLGSAKR